MNQTMNIETHTRQPITTLEELQLRKDALQDEIVKDEAKIRTMWNNLFHRPDMLTSSSPSKRLSSFVSTSAGIIDGAILGWKLYRKFKKK